MLSSPLLGPLWAAVAAGTIDVVTSELTLMETLVGAIKQGDARLEADYEEFFHYPVIRMIPITLTVLRVPARLGGHHRPSNARCLACGNLPNAKRFCLDYK
jgi:hypothetical protein